MNKFSIKIKGKIMGCDCDFDNTGETHDLDCPIHPDRRAVRVVKVDYVEHLKEELSAVKAENARLRELFNSLEHNSWDLRCVNVPTGGDDFLIEWLVIEHYQAKPQERPIAHGKTPIEALGQALK